MVTTWTASKFSSEPARADACLLEALRGLTSGVRLEAVEMLFPGPINVFRLPALRPAEVIVHHNVLDTTCDGHEVDPDRL